MLGIAQFLVWQIGLDNLPYFHEWVSPTDGWEYFVVELLDYQKQCEASLPVKMKCFRWFMQPREDIGV